MKGTGARNTVSPRFEGGQTPIHRRTPKAKGFRNPFRVEYVVVNLDTLEALDVGNVIDPGVLPRMVSLRSAVSSRSSVAASSRGP